LITNFLLSIGILARNIESDEKDLAEQNIEKIDIVVCNLYPFKETIAKPEVTIPQAVEEVDIGKCVGIYFVCLFVWGFLFSMILIFIFLRWCYFASCCCQEPRSCFYCL
jgi:hypothetical protein